jgi:outer membrane protein assembly factor BamB
MRRSLSREHRVALVLWLMVLSLLGAACENKSSPHALHTPPELLQSTASPSTQVVSQLVFVTGYTVNQPPTSTTEYFVDALNADDGSVRWRYLSQTSIQPPMVVTGQTVYIQQQTKLSNQTPATNLVALNAATGAVRWIFTTKAQFTVAQAGDTMYASMNDGPDPDTNSNSGAIAALNAATGAVRWQTAVNGWPGTPAVAGNTVFVVVVGGKQGSLYALDTASGQVRWQSSPRTSLSSMLTAGQYGFASAPLVLGNLVLAEATSSGASGEQEFSIIAYGVTDGHVRWQVQPGQLQSRTMAYGTVSDGHVLYLAYTAVPTSRPIIPQYSVEALRVGDGSTLWQTPIPYLPSPPVLAGGSIFLMGQGGLTSDSPADLLIALNVHSGAVQWHLPSRVDNLVGGVPVVDGSLVCIPTWIPTAASTPAVTPNPYVPRVIALTAYNTTTGKETWRNTLDSTHLPQPPLVDGDKLLVRFNNAFSPLVVIHAGDGQVLWRFGGSESTVTSVMPVM